MKTMKDQIGGYKNLKSTSKNWDRSWVGHQMKFMWASLKGNQLKRKRGFCKNWKNGQTNNWIEMKSSYVWR